MGYVYVLYNPESELVKIGKTSNPHCRFSSLSNQNGSEMSYYLSEPMYIYDTVEKVMLNIFNRYRSKGEWLKGISYDIVVTKLKEICLSKDFKRRNIRKDNQ